MAGRKKFSALTAKMSTDRRARIAMKAAALDDEMTLRELREKAGATQGDIAKAMDVSQTVVSRIEKPDNNILLGTLESYLRAIGAELEEEMLGTLSADERAVFIDSLNRLREGMRRRGGERKEVA